LRAFPAAFSASSRKSTASVIRFSNSEESTAFVQERAEHAGVNPELVGDVQMASAQSGDTSPESGNDMNSIQRKTINELVSSVKKNLNLLD